MLQQYLKNAVTTLPFLLGFRHQASTPQSADCLAFGRFAIRHAYHINLRRLANPHRAKDGWTDRERRNLTFTDVALGAKRKVRGGGGRAWRGRTKAGGSKIFAASGQGGGAVAAGGRAASRAPKGGGRKKRGR